MRPVRFGLAGRLAAGGAVVAILFGTQFALNLSSLRTIQRHTRAEQRAERSIVSAIRIEQEVVELSAASRGYVLTQNPTFLASWRHARARLPVEGARLARLQPSAVSRRINAAWRSYADGWSAPLIELARSDPRAAQRRIASLEGVRRIARLRAVVDPFVAEQDAFVTRDRARVASAERRAILTNFFDAGVRVVVFALVLLYLLRRIVWPIRRVADATRRIAGGEVGIEVPAGGAGEVGQLAALFNQMSRSLSVQRGTLADQNVDLERLANVLRAVLDSTVDGILLSDAEGNVQLANRPVIELTRDLGMTFEGTVVDRLLSVAPRIEDEASYRAAMERLRSNPNDSTFDEFEDSVSGRVFQGFTSPVHDDRGAFVGRVWTLREVTQQRELDRLKDDFVATVSHELRTPLTSMMGFLEMIREGEAGALTDEQKRFLTIVYRSSERLQRLVGDLLFVARLDASGLQLQFGSVSVDEVVQETGEAVSALARSRELTLRVDLGGTPPLWGDRERLAQLVSNLVSNAIKFTPAGGEVSVRTFVEGDHAVVEVADTGIGIPEEEQARLFQRFFRSSTATEQAIPGTGLGLVISKAIAEAHGGAITVRSTAGRGTCFRIELPLLRAEAAA